MRYAMKTYGGGGIAPQYLTSALERGLSLYSRGESPRYPLDMGLSGLPSRSGCCGEEQTMPLPGIQPRKFSL
jgi:hypothetical protein